LVSCLFGGYQRVAVDGDILAQAAAQATVVPAHLAPALARQREQEGRPGAIVPACRDDEQRTAWRAGQDMTLEQAVGYALACMRDNRSGDRLPSPLEEATVARPSAPGQPTQPRGDAGLRLAEVLAVFSLATDIGTGQPLDSALRACLLAVQLGERLGLSQDELADTYYLVLLLFAGCTADSHIAAAAFGDELAFGRQAVLVFNDGPAGMLRAMVRYIGAGRPLPQRLRALATALAVMARDGDEMLTGHCEVAHRLAARFGMRPTVQAALGQIYARWDGTGHPAHCKGAAIALPMRVAHLVHDVVRFHRLGGVAAAVAMARRRAGGAYDPQVVTRFCQDAPQLCAALAEPRIWEAVLAAEPGAPSRLAPAQIETATQAIADFVDLKSPYTVGHSRGVAALAARAAQQCGLPEADVVAIRQAGYLHDLGRVGISAGIWGKPGPLSQSEWEPVRLHPYYTERILARSPVLSRLGAIAALHHERLDGSGYHRGLPASLQLPTARLLAAADVYHALTESRPHRPALAPPTAAEIMHGEVRAGRLDGEAVRAVLGAAGHRVRARRRELVAGLSEREVEVLRLVARGQSNRQIAAQLHISAATVNHHVRHIYDKIDVSTRAAATLFAMEHALLDTTDDPRSAWS